MLGENEYYTLTEWFWINGDNEFDNDHDTRQLAECFTLKGLRLQVGKALKKGIQPQNLIVGQYALHFSTPSEFDDRISSLSYEEWILDNPTKKGAN